MAYSTGAGITCGVADAGRRKHADLEGVYLKGADLVYGDDDPFVNDGELEFEFIQGPVNNHGTQVDSVICAQNNDIGMTGIAPGVKIRPYRIFNENGWTTWQAIEDAILMAVHDEVDVLHLSLQSTAEQGIGYACEIAYKKGILITSAAGNFDYDLDVEGASFPTQLPFVLSVGASQRVEEDFGLNEILIRRAPFSNYGSEVDTFARGVDVVVAEGYRERYVYNEATKDYELTLETGSFYRKLPGTSFSSPMVAGLICLAKAIRPQLTIEEAIHLIRLTNVDMLRQGRKLLHAGRFMEEVAKLNDGGTKVPQTSRPAAAATVPGPPIPTRDEILRGYRAQLRAESFKKAQTDPSLRVWRTPN